MKKQAKRTTRRQAEEVEQSWPQDAEQLIPGRVAWANIYWVMGPMPTHSRSRNEIKDPPNAGWSSVLVMPAGGRRVRLFCPYSFEGFTVSEDSMEFHSLKTPRDRLRRTWMRELLYRQWAAFNRYGFQRDYDTAARIMQEMRWEVPVMAMPVKEVDPDAPPPKRRGKEVAESLIKPIPREGRRGEVLSWFMDSFEPRSIREAMAKFNTTRSNILTVLFQLNKEHGLGYRLSGDSAEVELPAKGCEKLFC